jgi:glycine/D-amino acid oxidase-like deaminating enzyme
MDVCDIRTVVEWCDCVLIQAILEDSKGKSQRGITMTKTNEDDELDELEQMFRWAQRLANHLRKWIEKKEREKE